METLSTTSELFKYNGKNMTLGPMYNTTDVNGISGNSGFLTTLKKRRWKLLKRFNCNTSFQNRYPGFYRRNSPYENSWLWALFGWSDPLTRFTRFRVLCEVSSSKTLNPCFTHSLMEAAGATNITFIWQFRGKHKQTEFISTGYCLKQPF